MLFYLALGFIFINLLSVAGTILVIRSSENMLEHEAEIIGLDNLRFLPSRRMKMYKRAYIVVTAFLFILSILFLYHTWNLLSV